MNPNRGSVINGIFQRLNCNFFLSLPLFFAFLRIDCKWYVRNKQNSRQIVCLVTTDVSRRHGLLVSVVRTAVFPELWRGN